MISLLGALPPGDLPVGKEYPYRWSLGTYPVKGNAVYKGVVGNDLLIVSTGKATMGKRILDLKHELLFPKTGGPVREIHAELTDPRGISIKWSAKRIP